MPNQILSNLTVTRVFAVNRLLKSPVGITNHRHNRERWAVALKQNGKTIYTMNGRDVLSDSTHPVILPKGCTYSWRCVEPGECIILEFDAQTTHSTLLSFNISDNTPLVSGFHKIEKYLYRKGEREQLECKHQLYGIFLLLAKSEQKKYAPKTKRQILTAATDYIAANYYDPAITNDFLAELCKISTVYFRKTFETVYGVSPIKYLHSVRINKAKALLLSDYESIGQVAESVGYNSIYHFSKMFKSYTGISPTEYAKGIQ